VVPREPDINAPFIGAAIAITVLIVAALATWIPARRAATINPVSALKVE
jgi:ABC-type lipoprotein release transport system permease subunit